LRSAPEIRFRNRERGCGRAEVGPPPQLREFDSILLAAGSWPELKMFFTPDLMPLELRGFWGKTDTIHGLFVSLAAASRTSSLISFSVGLPWAFIASL